MSELKEGCKLITMDEFFSKFDPKEVEGDYINYQKLRIDELTKNKINKIIEDLSQDLPIEEYILTLDALSKMEKDGLISSEEYINILKNSSNSQVDECNLELSKLDIEVLLDVEDEENAN